MLDEGAVDLDGVDGKAPEIFKRTHARPEIVEADAAASLARLADELFGSSEIGDCGGFGDLEADAGMRRPGFIDDGVDEIPKLRIAQGLRRQVEASVSAPDFSAGP